jgi:hypothetical protein
VARRRHRRGDGGHRGAVRRSSALEATC